MTSIYQRKLSGSPDNRSSSIEIETELAVADPPANKIVRKPTEEAHYDHKRKLKKPRTVSRDTKSFSKRMSHQYEDDSSSDDEDRTVESELNTVDLFVTETAPTTIWLGLDLDLVIKAGESVNMEFDPSDLLKAENYEFELDDVSYDLGVTIMGLSQISTTLTRMSLDRHRYKLHIWNSSAYTLAINSSRIFVYLTIVQHHSHIPRKTIASI